MSLSINQNKAPKAYKNQDFSRRADTIHLGIVRNNVDPLKMGRLSVWIPELGQDQETSWVTVQYASPFAGSSPIENAQPGGKTEDQSQRSYGWWATPPDIGNRVLCCFLNGDLARGFYFASIWQQNMNHMVPSAPMGNSTDEQLNALFAPLQPPTVEYNKKDDEVDPNDPARPVNNNLARGLTKQGLASDYERGISGSSARRESPSKVMGLLSPSGNSLYVDDDPDNEHIRIRTKSGVQILVHESSGYIYMNTKEGNSWVEISDKGIDMYSEGPINMRSKNDFNIYADEDVNISAGKEINLYAANDVGIESKKNVDIKAGEEFRGHSKKKLSMKSGAEASFAGSDVALRASGKVNVTGSGPAVVSGSTVKLNSGGGKGPKAASAKPRETIRTADAPKPTVTSRTPTREPYARPSSNSGVQPKNGGTIGGTRPIKRSDGKPAEISTAAPDTSEVVKMGPVKVTKKVNEVIMQAAKRTGVPYEALMAIANKESTLDPSARNGSHIGLFQISIGNPNTWGELYERYGPNGTREKNPQVVNNPSDPYSNALMGAYYVKQNRDALIKANLTLDKNTKRPSATETYFLHLLGETGGKKFLRALQNNPNQSAQSVLSSSAYNGNRDFHRKTVQQVYDHIDQQIGKQFSRWTNFKNQIMKGN